MENDQQDTTVTQQESLCDYNHEKPEHNNIATQFAEWMKNPLISIALADPRLCRFIADLLSGQNAELSAKRNFPQEPAEMPASIADKFGMDAETATAVGKAGLSVMSGDWSDNAVGILLKAVNHDKHVKEAESDGYIRGRNEAIDLKRHRRMFKAHVDNS